ncbi:hypothetical protein J2X90_005592 [Variovorax paradoxus]|uniref:hypothetical protein n=1 Tax=Variovorax paradoxus TaxID=34073 RepID=UPI002787BE57|nr:hypothetical protein [Variovorax paradoxus]MDQ0027756.1 hypothetical protein [Variovorax paradoxus]
MGFFAKRVLRGLTREEEEAMQLWLRILSPRCGADERAGMRKSINDSIRAGRWWPHLRLWEAAALFYPNDRVKESHLLALMERAVEEGELIAQFDPPVVDASSLAGWTSCPPVPADSALVLWLPKWMSQRPPELPMADTTDAAENAGAPLELPMQALPKFQLQEKKILALLREMGLDPKSLPAREKGKPGCKAEAKKTALVDRRLFTDKSFDKAWERLRGGGELAGD